MSINFIITFYAKKIFFLEDEVIEVNKVFKEKLEADGEHEFLEALIRVGFFDE